MIWEGLIVKRGPFNMFQNILDLFLPPTHLSLKKLILLSTCDWELFKYNLKDNFQDNWANVSNNVNDIWETWKYIVNTARH
jgi:hypothetical protein